MMLFSLLQYAAAFLLGTLVSVLLSGVSLDRHKIRPNLLSCVILLAVQAAALKIFDLAATKMLYPLMVHLPLWAILVLVLKAPRLQSAVAVLLAYLCCQPVRWVASVGLLIPTDSWLYTALYIPCAAIFLFCMQHYLAQPIRQFMVRSQRACLTLGLMPALYYVFDYATTVYTDLLISGNLAVVQFMPSVLSIVYLHFLFLYHSELERQGKLTRERDLLTLQLHQSKIAFSAMQQNQENTMRYRHDMRHHFALLQAMAAEDDIEQIRQYLSAVNKDMDSLTPVRYCGNNMVNLLLSYYASAAQAQNVPISITAALPARLTFSETELCSLLSNGLENAVHAAAQVANPEARQVSVHMGTHGGHLLIQIQNTYTGNLLWKDGLPFTHQQDHGFGVRSIRSIARAQGGEAIFREEKGLFQLRIMLPVPPVGDS